MNAPLSRAVPDARCRVASSVIAVVSVRPGMSTISPAMVVTSTDSGPDGEGAAELEHEPDGGGIGLVAAPLETVMGIGHLGSG